MTHSAPNRAAAGNATHRQHLREPVIKVLRALANAPDGTTPRALSVATGIRIAVVAAITADLMASGDVLYVASGIVRITAQSTSRLTSGGGSSVATESVSGTRTAPAAASAATVHGSGSSARGET